MFIRLICVLLLSLSVARADVLIQSFDDVTYWVGSGTNSAALVIDWNDGTSPVSLAWGFHWDGIATGQDMFLAIAGIIQGDLSGTGADPHLALTITSFSFGDAVTGIAYTGAGFSHDSAGFESGGYWEYYCSGGTFDTPPDGAPNAYAGSLFYPGSNGTPDWVSSFTGFGDRILSDGSWDGWSFAPGFVSEPLDQPVAAVPEPSTVCLLVLAACFAIWWTVERNRGRNV